MNAYYYPFSRYLKDKFNVRVHRLSLNAGFSCPNRDGTLGQEGCIFCNEKGFANFSGDAAPELKRQISISMDYYRKRFKAEKFIAYFQNASNTYARLEELRSAYDVIREFPDIAGLMISTRPDCVDEEKLSLIEEYADDYDVWVEYGLQTSHDKSLDALNRGHTYSQFVNAVNSTAKRRIKVAAHIIIGVPAETRDDILGTARQIASLPVCGVKLHVFHIVKDTKACALYLSGGIKLLEEKEYVGLACDFLEHLAPDCVIMRLVSNARQEVLIAPDWINDKQKILSEIDNEFKRRGTSQGSRYAGGVI